MRLNIHNVVHGGCISLKHQNGNSMVWDCGHQENYCPSYFLPYTEEIYQIDRFFITSYNEDHISDLPNLKANLALPLLHRDTSIDAPSLKSLKQQSGPISTAMESMLSMIKSISKLIMPMRIIYGVIKLSILIILSTILIYSADTILTKWGT